LRSGRSFPKLALQPFEKGFARSLQPLFQTSSAVASAASPGFGSILVTAFAAIMCVLYPGKVEVLFPIRTLFLERSRAVADFNPTGGLIRGEAGVTHVAKVLALRDRAMAESFGLNRLQQVALAAGFYAGSDKITHTNLTLRVPLGIYF